MSAPTPEPPTEDDEWGEPCWECGDEGWILLDCMEDSCCCLYPEDEHGYQPCQTCNRQGR